MAKLTARVPLFDENGMQVPGYLELDVRWFMHAYAKTVIGNPIMKLVVPGKDEEQCSAQ